MKLKSTELNKFLLKIKNTYPKSKHIAQRGVGDLLEGYVIDEAKLYSNFELATGPKSTGDFGFTEDNKSVLVDIKTHNAKSSMSMPNLISMKKLLKIIDNNEELYYLFLSYNTNKSNIDILNKKVISVYDLNVNNLGIGALGNGQLQIKDYNKSQNTLTKTQTKSEFISEIKTLYKNFAEKQKDKWEKMYNLI